MSRKLFQRVNFFGNRVNCFSKSGNRVNFFSFFLSPSLSFLILRSLFLVLVLSLGSPFLFLVLVPRLCSLPVLVPRLGSLSTEPYLETRAGCGYCSRVRVSRYCSVDREPRQGTKTGNIDREPRRETKTANKDGEQKRRTKTKNQD